MDKQILKDIEIWEGKVVNAKGWPSAYYAAKQLATCVRKANAQGHNVKNKYPIKKGECNEFN